MKIDVDFRLLDVSFEIGVLRDHLDLVDQQMIQMEKDEHEKLKAYIKSEKLTPDDPEWHFAHQEYDHRFDFLLPRIFRGPFIVALYAVYETSVIEIARLIQKTKGHTIALNDLRGTFLKRSKKYYYNILQFELYKSEESWGRINMLAELRHALAHANGRIEMLRDEQQKNIKKIENLGIGVEDFNGFIVFSGDFVKETFELVRSSLEDLVERYKVWDEAHKAYSH
jgi:hypothetical protein